MKTLCRPWMFQAHYMEIWSMWEANLEESASRYIPGRLTLNLKKLKRLGFQLSFKPCWYVEKQTEGFSKNIWKILQPNPQVSESFHFPISPTDLEHRKSQKLWLVKRYSDIP